MTNEEKLQELERKVNDLKANKIRSEEQLKSLRQQKEEIMGKIQELGIDPNNLSAEITKLEKEIYSEISQIESQIPK